MSGSLRDKIAIVGMGCTKFGEMWDLSGDDLMIDAAQERSRRCPTHQDDVEAFWYSHACPPGTPACRWRRPSRSSAPVTRVENFCASGSGAFRNAAFAVAAGVYDVAMAVGVEKLKDSGYSGLTLRRRRPTTPRPWSATRRRTPCCRPVRGGYGVDSAPPQRVDSRRVEEPQQRCEQRARAVHLGRRQGEDRQRTPRRRRPQRLRLLRRRGRCGGGDHRACRRRPQVHRPPDVPQGDVAARGCQRGVGHCGGEARELPRGDRLRGRGLRPGRDHRPAHRSCPWPRCTTASRRPR